MTEEPFDTAEFNIAEPDGDHAKPLLSICIPTYNRAALLGQGLHAVLSQIASDEAAHLEVLVLDNASSDDTRSVAEHAMRHFPHVPFRYIKHQVNIGMDNNFLQAVLAARADFVFLLSDDDILLPGAVSKLLTLIRLHPNFDGFCLNVRSFAQNPDEANASWLELPDEVTLRNCDSVLELIRGHITYMSIMAFNKSRISDNLASGHYKNKVGTYFLQCYLFLDVLSAGKGFVATSTPLVAQRVDNAHRLNFFRVFVTEFHALMDYAEKLGYSRQAVLHSKDENLIEVRHFLSRVFIYNRQTELWSSRRDGIVRLFHAFGFRPYLWLGVVPLMFFPRWLRPVAYAVRRLLGRPEIKVGKDVSVER